VASDDDDGKANEGILEFRKVESLEPLSLVINPAVDPNIALIYEVIGDRDQAMTWLNRACESRFDSSILLRRPWILCDRMLDSAICGTAWTSLSKD
jgi:hypothetical protein